MRSGLEWEIRSGVAILALMLLSMLFDIHIVHEVMVASYQHFSVKERDRDAWECIPVHFYPGGKRKLYGYIWKRRQIWVT